MKTIDFKSQLYKHQQEQVKFHLMNPRSANWSEMGTGKTVVALKYASVLMNSGLARQALIVCPLSVLHTWELEIAKHTNMTLVCLTGTLQDKLALLKNPADMYAISYDSIPGRRTDKYDTYGIMMGALLSKEFDLFIGDEVNMIKGYGTLRTRAITIMCDKIPFSLFLSGTPISNNPSEIANIYRALDGGKTFGRNFFAFRNKFFQNVGFAFPKWELKEHMRDELVNRMYSIAVRVKKDDCFDLPPKIFSPRFCYLSDGQKDKYIPVAEGLIKTLELDEGQVRIQNAMTKIIKLSQIASGFLYTDNETYYFPKSPKLDLALSLVKDMPDEKIIIYCYWQEDVILLSRALAEAGVCHGTLYGATSPSDRGKAIDRFQNGDMRVLVANIGVGGYGLTLTASSTIIYYNLSFKVIDFLQSQDRIHRHGQSKTCLYLPVMARGTIDEYIYHNVVRNTAIAESIVDSTDLKESLKRFLNENS